MKDYSEQIMLILASHLKTDIHSDESKIRLMGLAGISDAVKDLNLMIRNEIVGLEQQVVSLTEELNETDYLLLNANKVEGTTILRPKIKQGAESVRRQRMVHH